MNLAKSKKKVLVMLLAVCMFVSGLQSMPVSAEELIIEEETGALPAAAGGPETEEEIIGIGEAAGRENPPAQSGSEIPVVIEDISDVTVPAADSCEAEAEQAAQGTEQIELEEPVGAAAVSSIPVTLNVNQQKTLYLTIEPDETFISGLWNSNSSDLEIRTMGGTSCTVKALAYSSVDLVVDCTYRCWKRYTIAGRTYTHMVTHYESYLISINGGDKNIPGEFTISSSSSVVNMDMAAGERTLTLTTGVDLSDVVYIKDDAPSGNCVSVSPSRTERNKVYYTVYAYARGMQTVTFQLIWKQSPSQLVIKDSVKVQFVVSCSHRYGQGTVTKQPTATEEGVRVYTCERCGEKKTEAVPTVQNTMEECEITLSETEYTYSGRACRPDVTVRRNGSALKQGTDYEVAYRDNVNAGTAAVNITGKGAYCGAVSRSFVIRKAEQNLKVSVGTDTLKTGGTLQILTEGIGTISFSSDNSSAASVDEDGLVTAKAEGNAVITVRASGDGNYNSASKNVTIHVTGAQPAKVSFSKTEVRVKAGESSRITISASGELPPRIGFLFKKSGDACFRAAWEGSWRGKSHDLTVTGTGEGTGTLEIYLRNSETGEIIDSGRIKVTTEREPDSAVSDGRKVSVSDCTLRLSSTAYTYNGREKTPFVTVRNDGRLLLKDVDYTVRYQNNVNAGTASVIITGKGDYTGSAVRTFVIRKAAQNFRLTKSSCSCTKNSLRYSGKSFRIQTVNAKGTVSARSGSRYIQVSGRTVTVRKGTPRGIYRVTVTAAGNTNYSSASRTMRITVR